MISKENIQCTNCEKHFLRYKSKLTKSGNNYCSSGCRLVALHKKVLKYEEPSYIKTFCAKCNVSIVKSKYEIRGSKSGNTFCSKSCAASLNNTFKIGDKHPNWKGGRGREYRRSAFRAYKRKCNNVECPLTLAKVAIPDFALDVDHINGKHSDNRIDNLQILCVYCHAYKTRVTTYQNKR